MTRRIVTDVLNAIASGRLSTEEALAARALLQFCVDVILRRGSRLQVVQAVLLDPATVDDDRLAVYVLDPKHRSAAYSSGPLPRAG